jgi:hypothetical protein
MTRAATSALALVVGFVALLGLIAVFNSRDDSEVAGGGGERPGQVYRGEPVLSPALQDAVERGNVVVLHRDEDAPPGTKTLVPPGGKALEDAGQSVLIEREPTLDTPLAALSESRIQKADTPGELQGFVDYWLGGR